MKLKLLIPIILVCLIIIPTALAFEFDNKKYYDEKERKVTVKNSFLGIPLDTVAELKLLTPQHYKIWGTGYAKVAEIEIELFESYEGAFKKIDFYKKRTMQQLPEEQAGFDYKYKTTKIVQQDVYETICEGGPGSKCVRTKKGKESVEIEEWNDFDALEELPPGKIIIGIFYHDVSFEIIEWVPTFFGVEIEEWADFGGAQMYEYWAPAGISTYYVSTTTRKGGQTFTVGNVGPPEDFTIAGISMNFKGVTNPGMIDSVGIWTTNSTGLPDTLIVQNTTVNSSQAHPTSFRWFNITLPEVTLINDTEYAIVIGHVEKIELEYASENGYGGGGAIDSLTGDSWTFPPTDNQFMVWGNPIPGSIILNVTLNDPIDNAIITSAIQYLNASHEIINGNLTNTTLYVWNNSPPLGLFGINFTYLNGTTNSTNLSFSNFVDGNYFWNYWTCGVNSTSYDCAFADANRSFSFDLSPPTIDFTNLIPLYSSRNVSMNYTVVDAAPDTCWYSISEGLTNVTLADCGTNATVIMPNGNVNISIYVNDTANLIASDTFALYVISLFNQTYEGNITEATTHNYSIGVFNGSTTLVSANFTYNNTVYVYDNQLSNGSTITINRSVFHEMVSQIHTQSLFWWNTTWLLGTDYVNLSTVPINQTVVQMNIGNCTDGLSAVQTLNFSITDENTGLDLNATYEAEFLVWTELEVYSRTLNLQTLSIGQNNTEFGFCINPEFGNFTSNYLIQYSWPGYITREFHVNDGLLSNATRYFNLTLAPTGNTIAIVIHVQNENGNAIQNVVVEAQKRDLGDGTFETVDTELTGPDGVAIMDIITGDNFYKFVFKIDGVTRLTSSTFKVTETEYYFTITTGGTSGLGTLALLDTITSSLVFNESGCNLIEFSWTDNNDVADSFRFEVVNLSSGGAANVLTTQTSTNTSGTMVYRLGNVTTCVPYSGTFTASGYTFLTDDPQEHLLEFLNINLKPGLAASIKRDGLLFALILVGTFAGIGAVSGNPVIFVVMIIVGLFVAMAPGFIQMSSVAMMVLVVLGAIYIRFLKT